MKLMVVASMPETATANYFVRAFRRSGHELLVCSDVPGPNVNVVTRGLVDADAVMRSRSFAADAVLFFEGGSMRLLPDTRNIRSCPTAWYAIDTHMDFDKHVRIARLFDASFVAQKQYVSALADAGARRAQWLPLAFATELAPASAPARDVDIAYVGSENAGMHPQRSALLAVLRRTFDSTRFGRATPEEMGRIYASAKLVFNRSINNDVNMRFFEAMGAGAVLLTDRIVDNGVEDLFEEERHYLVYRDEADLLGLARKLLADPARLRAIGDAAQACVLADHTYQHRADQIVAQVRAAEKAPTPTAVDVFGACLSLGLTAEALRVAADALALTGGGRFQRALGKGAGHWVRLASAAVAGADRLRRAVRSGRHA
jgi:hypothetical protein